MSDPIWVGLLRKDTDVLTEVSYANELLTINNLKRNIYHMKLNCMH